MSRLVLTLRAGETMLLEGAELYFPATTRLHLLSQVRFVFGRQYMPEAQATTPLQRFYFELQQFYAGPVDQRAARRRYAEALTRTELPGHHVFDAERILATADAGQFYAALKAARTLYELSDAAAEMVG
jgi:flagellar protein FlbT